MMAQKDGYIKNKYNLTRTSNRYILYVVPETNNTMSLIYSRKYRPLLTFWNKHFSTNVTSIPGETNTCEILSTKSFAGSTIFTGM